MFYVALSLYFASFTILAYTLWGIVRPHRSVLGEQIGFYERSWRSAYAGVDEHEPDLASGLRAAIKRQAITFISRERAADFIRMRLDRTGLKTDWREFVFYHLLGVSLGGVGAYIAMGPIGAVLVIAAGSWLPIGALDLLAGKRQALFKSQLPETLTMIAGSLKAGYSLLQAIDMVARETTPPMAAEFQRVLADARLGLPVEQALEKMATRVESLNFDWMIMAVKIQREVGGNLAEVLETLASTIRERDKLVRQIKVLTAEGRLSAIILLILPLFVAASLYLLNPGYMGLLFTTTAGLVMAGAALALMGVGTLWLRKVIKIEV